MTEGEPETHMIATDRTLSVLAQWDAEAGVWAAASNDVPGLAAEAASLDELFRDLQLLIPELLELNGMADGDSAPFQLVATNGKAGAEAA